MANKELKRELGLFSAISILVGSVIGSGIFTTPGKIAALAGSIGPNMLAWLIAGVCCVFCALVYAELSPAMPKAGGPYVYIDVAFGHAPSFIYGWSCIVASFIPVIAMMSVAFSTYLSVLIPGMTLVEQRLVSSGIIIFLAIMNIMGVKSGSTVQNIFTVAKLSVLILVIVGGIFCLRKANFITMTTETVEWSNTFKAAVPALTAFGGYNMLSFMSGEIKNPKRNLPLATIIGIGIVVIINVLISISCIGTVGFAELAGSDTPVSAAAQVIFGHTGLVIITIGAMVSIFGALNGAMLGMPRVAYSMAENNMMFPFFSKLHPKRNTPYIAIIFFAVGSVAFCWAGNYMMLLMMGTFVTRMAEVFISAALMVLRKKMPNLERPFRMWGYPVSCVLAILITGFLATQVAPTQIMQACLLMLTSIPAYFIFKHFVLDKAKQAEKNVSDEK